MSKHELGPGESRLTGERRYRAVRHWFRTVLVLEVQIECYSGMSKNAILWRTARAEDLEQSEDTLI